MISAQDALRLPAAKLRPSDQESVTELLKDIEKYILTHMDRGGCVVPIEPQRINGAISAEVLRICKKLGWVCEFQQKIGRSALTHEPTILGFQLSLQPGQKAYDEVGEDVEIRELGRNLEFQLGS